MAIMVQVTDNKGTYPDGFLYRDNDDMPRITGQKMFAGKYASMTQAKRDVRTYKNACAMLYHEMPDLPECDLQFQFCEV